MGLENVKEAVKKGDSILHYAVQLGYWTIIRLLHGWGVDVNTKSIFTGTTPLLIAVSPSHLSEDVKKKTVAVLLECDAKIDVENKERDSPLFMAAVTGQSNIVDLLLGPENLVKRDKDGNTILHIAAQVNAFDICKLVSDKEYMDDELFAAQNNDGQTPVHLAAMHDCQCLDAMISALKGRHGEQHYLKFVEWFSAPDRNRSTPLDVAAKAGQKETFKTMWRELEERDKDGDPPHIKTECRRLNFLIGKAKEDASQWQGVIEFLKVVPKRM